MDVIQIPLGSIASADLSLSGGSLVITVKISAQAEIDNLLKALAAKEAALAPVIGMVQAGIDAALK